MRTRTTALTILIVAVCVVNGIDAASPGQADADRGSACFRRGDFAEALAAFERAVSSDPGHLRAWRDLGWAHQRLGDEAEAIRIWENLLKLDPGFVDVHNALGETHLARGRSEKARSHFRKSLDLDADQPDTRLRLGEALDALGRPDEAAVEYRQVRASNPSMLSALTHLTDLLERQGDLSQALDLLREAVDRTPVLLEPLRPRLARLEGRIADATYAREDYPAARDAYRSALVWEPSNVRLLTSLAWSQRRCGDLEGAIATWTRADSLAAPPSAAIVRNIADAERELGRLDDARRTYERAVVLDPDDPVVLLHLARIASAEGDANREEEWLEKLMALSVADDTWTVRAAGVFESDDEAARRGIEFFERTLGSPSRAASRDAAISRLLTARAGSAQRGDRIADAIDLYDEALRRDPRNAQAMRDLGWALWRAGRWTDCEATWLRYADAYPDRAQPYDLLAQLHLLRSDFPAAVEDSRRSLEREPANKPARFRLVRALLNAGHAQEALRLAEDLVREDPESAIAHTLWAEGLTRSRKFALAAERWAAVLAIDPDSARAGQQRVICLYESGATAEALELARRAAEETATPLPILELLAQDAALREDWSEAATLYARLTREAPETITTWTRLSRALGRLARHDERIAALGDGVSFHPRRVELELEMASALSDKGDKDEALRRYRGVVKERPENRTAYVGLLDALVASRRYAEALGLLDLNRPGFLKEDDVAMRRAEILAARSETTAALRILDDLASRTASRSVPILVYHGLSDIPGHPSLAAGEFDDQMGALVAAGYTTITFNEFASMADGAASFPDRPVLVTFDDARADSFAFADPVLARHGVRATMFVPTDRIGSEDLFHVSWASLDGYVRSGRWELQSHGHEAHDPVIVDERGTTSPFVASPRWIEGEGRLESAVEFERRLESDYRTSRVVLERHFPGAPVIAYAFPFSEFGQEAGSDAADAVALNEKIAASEFRIGLVQDESGSNTITPGKPLPFLLRRFAVPHGWDGEALLAQLARHEPRTAAQLARARLLMWDGRLNQAENGFASVAKDATPLQPEIEQSLAEIALRRGRPRDARGHLDARLASNAERDPEVVRLDDRINWENRSRGSAQIETSSDSDRRSSSRQTVDYRYPFDAPVDIEAQIGRLRLAEDGMGVLSGTQFALRGRWAASPRLDLRGWLRQDRLASLDATTVGGIAANYTRDRHVLDVRGATESIDSARARAAGVHFRELAAGYSLSGSRWLPRFQLVERSFSDGNRRFDLRAGFLYRAPTWRRWQVGATFDRGDSEFQSAEYYTPSGLDALRGRTRYRHAWRSGSSIEAEGGLGVARDDARGTRWTTNARLSASKVWKPRLRTNFGLEYANAPGYRSSRADVAVQFLP